MSEAAENSNTLTWAPETWGIDPFLRWAGGKRRLAPQISKEIWDRLGSYTAGLTGFQNRPVPLYGRRYFEPYLGGGAVALALPAIPEGSVLSDYNQKLSALWACIVMNPQAVWDKLQQIINTTPNTREGYMKVRVHFNEVDPGLFVTWKPDMTYGWAAEFIYLNKTCFNGLWRVNKFDKFNVPYGQLSKPAFPTLGHLKSVADKLEKVLLDHGDAVEIMKIYKPVAGDCVYADPPYDSTFAAYTDAGFPWSKQVELAEYLRELHEAGVFVWASNANTPRIRELYSWAHIREVQETRNISAKSASRGDTTCLLITGHQP